jgi:RNA polymerase sigma-70 factor (ECF subfamily)
MDQRPDAAIIEASFARPSEFAALFDRHHDALYRYVARRVGPDLAQDVAAAAFEQALRSRARFDLAQPSARPWLLGIATNLLRHHYRSETRRLQAQARLQRPTSTPDHAPAVAARVDADRLAPVLRDALASLSAGERDVLLLHAWADLRYEEIATALRIPVGTVRSRLSRGRARLRERLARSGQSLDDNPRTDLVVTADG